MREQVPGGDDGISRAMAGVQIPCKPYSRIEWHRSRSGEGERTGCYASALGSDTQRGAVRGCNVHLKSENKGTYRW